LGLAGVLAVVGVTGAVAVSRRRGRSWTEMEPDELRRRLHDRLG
jgi:sensor histidine kinase regulating citrate/malate metabolism